MSDRRSSQRSLDRGRAARTRLPLTGRGSRKPAKDAAAKPKSERSRDLILRSAAQLFRNQGFAATTLRQIAARAKIKAGSIYYHFSSKEEILDEVLDRGLRHVFETVKQPVEDAGKA